MIPKTNVSHLGKKQGKQETDEANRNIAYKGNGMRGKDCNGKNEYLFGQTVRRISNSFLFLYSISVCKMALIFIITQYFEF